MVHSMPSVPGWSLPSQVLMRKILWTPVPWNKLKPETFCLKENSNSFMWVFKYCANPQIWSFSLGCNIKVLTKFRVLYFMGKYRNRKTSWTVITPGNNMNIVLQDRQIRHFKSFRNEFYHTFLEINFFLLKGRYVGEYIKVIKPG